MEINEIKSILIDNLILQEVYVSGNGNHFDIVAISEQFNNLSSLEKQKMIYAPLKKYIANNSIHALSIKTYTPQEWEEKNKISDINLN